jgi:hypothetical protein
MELRRSAIVDALLAKANVIADAHLAISTQDIPKSFRNGFSIPINQSNNHHHQSNGHSAKKKQIEDMIDKRKLSPPKITKKPSIGDFQVVDNNDSRIIDESDLHEIPTNATDRDDDKDDGDQGNQDHNDDEEQEEEEEEEQQEDKGVGRQDNGTMLKDNVIATTPIKVCNMIILITNHFVFIQPTVTQRDFDIAYAKLMKWIEPTDSKVCIVMIIYVESVSIFMMIVLGFVDLCKTCCCSCTIWSCTQINDQN